jgi:hypothetical protein
MADQRQILTDNNFARLPFAREQQCDQASGMDSESLAPT